MPTPTGSALMEKLVALCRRRGFIFQSSEIYGGINGFWDYGPLGVELKRNLKEAWWHDIVRCPAKGPDGDYLEMVDDRETKQRFRYDHVMCYVHPEGDASAPIYAFLPDSPSEEKRKKQAAKT